MQRCNGGIGHKKSRNDRQRIVHAPAECHRLSLVYATMPNWEGILMACSRFSAIQCHTHAHCSADWFVSPQGRAIGADFAARGALSWPAESSTGWTSATRCKHSTVHGTGRLHPLPKSRQSRRKEPKQKKTQHTRHQEAAKGNEFKQREGWEPQCTLVLRDCALVYAAGLKNDSCPSCLNLSKRTRPTCVWDKVDLENCPKVGLPDHSSEIFFFSGLADCSKLKGLVDNRCLWENCTMVRWQQHNVQINDTTWVTFFFVRARCLSAGLRSWVLLTDQRGIEPPPAVCQRRKSDVIPTEPWGQLNDTTWITLRSVRHSQYPLSLSPSPSAPFLDSCHPDGVTAYSCGIAFTSLRSCVPL